MKLIVKFNLILLVVFAIGMTIASLVSYQVTKENAYLQVKDQASLMLQQQFAVRKYTIEEVRPALKELSDDKVFHPQTVPAYSVRQVFKNLAEVRPNYNVRVAVLNPTSLKNKASGWEREIVKRFVADRNLKEEEGEIILDNEKLFYFATPVEIKNPKCLACHSTPSVAPTALLAKYGSENGFGWSMEDIIGARVVTVPFTLPLELAKKSFWNFFTSMLGVFLALFVALNILMNRLIIKPILSITKTADVMSRGDLSVKPMKVKGKDEISVLAASFNRMMRSTSMMAKMLRKQQADS